MTPITIRNLGKTFGQTVAVDAVDITIDAGDLFFLLGPSGCGKTTLLRMIAGFTQPTAGEIHFGQREVTHIAAHKRNTGMVFQGYALWPHMTVRQNVAFGLDVRKIPKEDKANRVDQALKAVHMLALADRKPNELSGGQQQRVALARALVIEPTVLLLDEPLSNLDAKLRVEMRTQIRDICKQAGITAIYVTHDQKEALSMADKIAVMRNGNVAQVGSPRELYHRPAGRFVADFLGETNFVSAEVVGKDAGQVILQTTAGTLHSSVFPDNLPATGNVTCSIRPEALSLHAADATPNDGRNVFHAKRAETVYLGEIAQHHLHVGDDLHLKAYELNPRMITSEQRDVAISVAADDVVILGD